MSKSLFCVQLSFQEDLPGHIAMLFSPVLLHFLSLEGYPWFKPCSLFNSSYSCLAAHSFHYTDRALCTSIFLTSFGQTYLMSIVISSLKTSVCASTAISYPSHDFHTSPLLQALSPISTSEPHEFASSKILFVRLAIFLSILLLPNTEWPWWPATSSPLC